MHTDYNVTSEFLKHEETHFSISRCHLLVQDESFGFSLNPQATISANRNRFPGVAKAISYPSAPLETQHPNMPWHFIFSSVILLLEDSTGKASQETTYISPHFNTAVTQYKRGQVIFLPRDGTTKKSVSSFLKGLCSTQISNSIFTALLSSSVNIKSPHCLQVKPADLLRQGSK